MPRMIRHDATGPIRIDPQDKPVFICACGLSKNMPYCDGAHKTTRDEEPAVCYVYDKAREKIVDERSDAD